MDSANYQKSGSNAQIQQFEQEYRALGQVERSRGSRIDQTNAIQQQSNDARSMSINSRAQQVIDRQRIQQKDVEARERSMVNKRKPLGQNQLASLPNQDRNDYGAIGDVLQAPLGQQYGSLNNKRIDSGYRNDLQSGGSNNYSKSYNPKQLVQGLPQNANSLPTQYQRQSNAEQRINSLPKQSSKADFGPQGPKQPPQAMGMPQEPSQYYLRSNNSHNRLGQQNNLKIQAQKINVPGNMSPNMSPQLGQGGLGLRGINNRRNMDGAIGQSYSNGIPANGQISAINGLAQMGVKAPIISTIPDNRIGVRNNNQQKPNWWG